MATAGSIVIDLLMRTGSFETDSKRAEKRLKELKKEAVEAGKAIGAGLAVAATALAALTWQSIQAADQLDELSQRLGISTETLSGWGYAAKLSGTDLESLAGAIPKLSKNLAAAADEGSKAGQLFKALGIDVKDAAGNLRDVEDVLPEIADRFKALKNDTLEAALAQEVFGKSGAGLLEFLNRGGDGIEELTNRARELGLIVDGDTAAAAAEFKDRLDDLVATTQMLGLQIAEDLLPNLIELTNWVTSLTKEGGQAGSSVEVLTGFLRTAADVVEYFWSHLQALDNMLEGIVWQFQGATEAAKGFLNLDWDQISRGMALGREGLGQTFTGEASTSGRSSQQRRATFSDEAAIPRSMLGNANLPDPTARINRLLAGTESGGKKAAAQISEAEKAAKRLQDQFDQTLAGLEEQQYMLGKTGEEARVRYEVEFGALKNLDQAKKDQLITEAAYLDAMTKAREEAEKLAEATKRADEAFNDVNTELLAGVKLLGMSADEQEIWNNLAWAGVTAESERGRQIIENTKRLQAVRDAMDDQIQAMDALRDAGADFLADWLGGTKSFKESFLDALDDIQARILDMIAQNFMDQLFGKQGDPAGGSTGGWFQGILDGFFGSGGQSAQSSAMASGGAQGGGFWANVASAVGSFFGGGRAGGGDVLEGRGYWVGEQGPEWFQPRTAGTVMTNADSMAMAGRGRGAFNQTINVQVQDKRDLRSADQIGAAAATRAQIALRRNS